MKERFQGCLLGVALGDALGVPVTGHTSEEIKTQHLLPSPEALVHAGSHHDHVIPLAVDAPEANTWKQASGEFTPDSNLMSLTLESICTQRSISTRDMVERLRGWYGGTHPKHLSPLTAHVLARLTEGERWEEASEGASLDSDFNPPDGGNLPRCMPVALYHARRPEKLLADTITVSRLTHWDERATHSAVAINHLVSRLMQRDEEALVSLPSYLADKNPDVLNAVKSAMSGKEQSLDTSGSVLGMLGVAIWTLNNAPTFEDGVLMVLDLGGKTGLNAAVAVGLLGAKFSRQAIPIEWLAKLEGKVRVEVLANRLFEHA